MDRSFPLSLAVLGNLSLGTDKIAEKAEINKLVQHILTSDQGRMGWLDRQQALTKLRFGIRKPKTFPWPNASNLSIPLIDSQIRRYKPMLMRLLVEPDPIVEFVGEDPEAVNAERLCEAEYNWLFKVHMGALEPMAYVVDAICHRGYGIAQVGWDYQTEYETRVVPVADLFPQGAPQDPALIAQVLVEQYRLTPEDPRTQAALQKAIPLILGGAPFVKLAFKRVIVDRPALWDRDPVQVIVPPRTTDYGNAEWICVQHLFPIRKLQQLEADGFFVRGSVEKIVGDLKMHKPGTQVGEPGYHDSSSLFQDRALQDEHERIWGHETEESVLIWECFHWYDYDGDGLKDRTVSFIHPRSRTKLSCRPYAYPFHRWPFVKFDFEKTSRRFHSPRGISGMLEHIQREINQQHNGRIDAMTLRNAPVYQIPVLAGFKARNFRVVPGTVLQIPGGGELRPVVQDRGAWPEQMQEENSLRGLAENYIGTFDQAVQGPRGGAENRTATEINATVQLAASTASLDAILFQLAMKELHGLIWQLWMDLRPAEVSIKVSGQDPNSPSPTLVKIPKGEINYRYTLSPTGTIANTNRALELSNAREALTYFVNDQSGFVNHYELINWYFGLLDYRRARKILLGADKAQELVVLRQAAASIKADPDLIAGMQGGVEPAQEQVQQTEIAEGPPE